jgi:hypothetical protein
VDAIGWEFDTVILVPCKEKFQVTHVMDLISLDS